MQEKAVPKEELVKEKEMKKTEHELIKGGQAQEKIQREVAKL
jgi:hypothetical protein